MHGSRSYGYCGWIHLATLSLIATGEVHLVTIGYSYSGNQANFSNGSCWRSPPGLCCRLGLVGRWTPEATFLQEPRAPHICCLSAIYRIARGTADAFARTPRKVDSMNTQNLVRLHSHLSIHHEQSFLFLHSPSSYPRQDSGCSYRELPLQSCKLTSSFPPSILHTYTQSLRSEQKGAVFLVAVAQGQS